MTWRTARSLDVLLAQINDAHPARSKVSDGSIASAAHTVQNPSSDHEPRLSYGGVGIVCARDFTHDPRGGLDCNALAAALVRSGDKRIKYVIWNRRIWNPSISSAWRPYSGKNPHDHHLHLSVQPSPALYDSTRPWALTVAPPAPLTYVEVDVSTLPLLQHGAAGEDVETLQSLLVARKRKVAVDGEFGDGTAAALKAFQTAAKLDADAVCGPSTWGKLLRLKG